METINPYFVRYINACINGEPSVRLLERWKKSLCSGCMSGKPHYHCAKCNKNSGLHFYCDDCCEEITGEPRLRVKEPIVDEAFPLHPDYHSY